MSGERSTDPEVVAEIKEYVSKHPATRIWTIVETHASDLCGWGCVGSKNDGSVHYQRWDEVRLQAKCRWLA